MVLFMGSIWTAALLLAWYFSEFSEVCSYLKTHIHGGLWYKIRFFSFHVKIGFKALFGRFNNDRSGEQAIFEDIDFLLPLIGHIFFFQLDSQF